MGFWKFYSNHLKLVVFLSLFFYSLDSFSKGSLFEGLDINIQLSQEDHKNFEELSLQEKTLFLQRRADIIANIRAQLEKNVARVAWFTWAKGKVVGVFRPSSWREFIDHVVLRHKSDLNQLGEQQKLNYDREAVSKIFVNDIINKLDSQLIKNMKVLSSSHEWTLNLGAHLVTYAGFRKATAGVGMVLGVEVGRSFSDKNVRFTPYVDLEFIRHAYVPMVAASIEALAHFTVNGNRLDQTQRHELISVPGGGNYINNDKMFGFGLAWGVGLPPVVDQFAFYKLSASRFRLFAKKLIPSSEAYDRELAKAIPMCRLVFLKAR